MRAIGALQEVWNWLSATVSPEYKAALVRDEFTWMKAYIPPNAESAASAGRRRTRPARSRLAWSIASRAGLRNCAPWRRASAIRRRRTGRTATANIRRPARRGCPALGEGRSRRCRKRALEHRSRSFALAKGASGWVRGGGCGRQRLRIVPCRERRRALRGRPARVSSYAFNRVYPVGRYP